jgi:hypothetical protein
LVFITDILLGYRRSPRVYLAPFAICAVDGLDQLWVVQIEKVWSDANNRAVFLVELFERLMIVARSHLGKTPEVGPSCSLGGALAIPIPEDCFGTKGEVEWALTCEKWARILSQRRRCPRESEPAKEGG